MSSHGPVEIWPAQHDSNVRPGPYALFKQQKNHPQVALVFLGFGLTAESSTSH